MSIRSPFVSLALTLVFAAVRPASCSRRHPSATRRRRGTATAVGTMPQSASPWASRLTDFETKFIVPKCGQATCHGPSSVFRRNLDQPAMIRADTVGKKATLRARTTSTSTRPSRPTASCSTRFTAEGDQPALPQRARWQGRRRRHPDAQQGQDAHHRRRPPVRGRHRSASPGGSKSVDAKLEPT